MNRQVECNDTYIAMLTPPNLSVDHGALNFIVGSPILLCYFSKSRRNWTLSCSCSISRGIPSPCYHAELFGHPVETCKGSSSPILEMTVP